MSIEHPTAEELAIRDLALSYPGAHEDFPWGERALKVKGKVFVFLHGNEKGVGISVKLPLSAADALKYPGCTPTGYGLGKSGWVSARFPAGEPFPFDLIRTWVHESYLAVAPKKLIAQLMG